MINTFNYFLIKTGIIQCAFYLYSILYTIDIHQICLWLTIWGPTSSYWDFSTQYEPIAGMDAKVEPPSQTMFNFLSGASSLLII